MSKEAGNSSFSGDDFSVVVMASDIGNGIDARPFLSDQQRQSSRRREAAADDEQEQEDYYYWHDCSPEEDFSDLELLQFFRLLGSDRAGNPFFRIVGKYFPAPVVSAERLKKYVFHKICSELPEGPFCIVYFHTCVQKEDNSPGLSILRWIYEDLPPRIKRRLQLVYFIHPGIRSRLAFATLGRFLLTGGLYWKIKYVSRLQYLWEDIEKEEIEIPEFVRKHDDVLEHRPLTDYGIEPDTHYLTEVPTTAYSFGRYEDDRWTSSDYMS